MFRMSGEEGYMSPRKKKGIGFFISGAVFLVAGFVFVSMDATPEWVASSVSLVGLIAEFFGFKTVFPDYGD